MSLAPTSPAVPVQRDARAVVAVLCLGGLTASLMQTLVLPIQGDLPELLNTSRSNAAWVVTATLLAGAVTMPVAGRLADMFGKQRILMATGAMLLIGSLVAAMADTLTPMLIGRFLQGMAMGYIPVAISMVREVAPPKLAPVSIAAISATMGIGGAIGIPAAAWVSQSYDFHYLFWFSAGLALVSLLCTIFLLPHLKDGRPARFDVLGMLGLGVGLSSVLAGVSKGNDWGWASATTWLCIGAGVLVLLVWGYYELRTRDPLVDLRTTARRPVLLTNLAAVLIGFGMMANSIVIPQLMTLPLATGHGMGLTLLEAGLWMTPGGFVMLLMAPVSGRLINTIGARLTLAIGAVVLGLAYLVGVFMMSEPWQLMISLMLSSAGVGLGFAAMPSLILDNVPMREAGASVGLNGLMRAVGTTIAAALMATVLTSSVDLLGGGFAFPTESAFRLCFLIGAVAAFVGAAITLGVPKRVTPVAAAAEEPVAV